MSEKERQDILIEQVGRRQDADRPVEVEEEKVKVVIFTLRDGLYGLYGADVKELLPMMEIAPVPGTPDYILGVINNRGDIESVISLNMFLGRPDSDPDASTRIAIASKGGVRSGILVDSVVDVIDVAASSIEPPLSTFDSVKKDFTAGEGMCGDRGFVLLDLGRIFGKLCTHDE